jgi:hypothetical protein
MGGYYNLRDLRAGRKAPAPQAPASGTDASGNPLRIDVYNDTSFGFMRMTVSAASITGEVILVDPTSGDTSAGDSFVLNLQTNIFSDGIAE